MNKVAIIQARMGSTRLPGKVLKPILGIPMLELLLGRVIKTPSIDKVVVATTDKTQDDVVATLVDSVPGIFLFRGSESNVLERYYLAAKRYNADIVLRITADNPFFDEEVAEQLLEHIQGGMCDYVSNNRQKSFPYGIDLEVFTFTALEEAFHKAASDYDLEHVTPYITAHPKLFRLHGVRYKEDLSHIRLTVDTADDYRRAVELFERFGKDVTFREIADAEAI